MIVTFVTFVGEDLTREVPFAVTHSYIGLALGFGQVQWLVQVLVDEMVLRAFLAVDVFLAAWRHADQMYLKIQLYKSVQINSKV